jgi:hypothetical protein
MSSTSSSPRSLARFRPASRRYLEGKWGRRRSHHTETTFVDIDCTKAPNTCGPNSPRVDNVNALDMCGKGLVTRRSWVQIHIICSDSDLRVVRLEWGAILVYWKSRSLKNCRQIFYWHLGVAQEGWARGGSPPSPRKCWAVRVAQW